LKNIIVLKGDLTSGTYHQFEIKQKYNNQKKFMIDVTLDGRHIFNDEITFPLPARTDNQIIYMGSPYMNAAQVRVKDFKFRNLEAGKNILNMYTRWSRKKYYLRQ